MPPLYSVRSASDTPNDFNDLWRTVRLSFPAPVTGLLLREHTLRRGDENRVSCTWIL